EQPLRLGGLAYGPGAPEQWGKPTRDVDFFDVKGDLEALAAPRHLVTHRLSHPALHPGRAAEIVVNSKLAGWLGELHPRLVRQFELPKAPVVFELDLDVLTDGALPTGKAVSRLPIVRRDLALVVDEIVAAGALMEALERAVP